MKRLSEKHKVWQLRHASRSFRRTVKVREPVHDRPQRAKKKKRYFQVPPSIQLDVPATISLTSNYNEMVNFITSLRELALRRKRRLSLNFKTIEQISPAAALFLAAELDRWRRVRSLRLRAVDLERWNPEVRRLLFEMGLFQLLHVTNPPRAPDPNSSSPTLKFIKFWHGTEADGKLAKLLRRGIEEVGGKIIAKGLLYEGLTEAMTNAVQHAYPKDGNYAAEPIPRSWWMSGSYNSDQSSIRIMFYDQGVGIPATLPTFTGWEKVRALLDSWKLPVSHDAAMIKAAIVISRTETGDPERGHGLENIRRLVEASSGGKMRILSGRGEYIYHQGGQDQMVSHDEALGGTLIQWEIFVKPTSM